MILVLLASLFFIGCSPENKQKEDEWETKYPDVPTSGVTDPNWGKF